MSTINFDDGIFAQEALLQAFAEAVNADVQNSFLRDSVIYQNPLFGGGLAQSGVVPRIPVTSDILPFANKPALA